MNTSNYFFQKYYQHRNFFRTSFLIGIIGIIVISSANGLFLTPAQGAGNPALPVVAIHNSELTQALESLPANSTTPPAPAGTGYQWWVTEWHYFVAIEALKEALNSDGIPYVEISDADIIGGNLIHTDGTPRYPIVISLGAEVIHDDEIAPLREYVSSGGFLFVGSSSFTRYPDGTSRGDFALASEMGITMTNAQLENWYMNLFLTRQTSHRLVDHIPSGMLNWRLPTSNDEIPIWPPGAGELGWEHLTWEVGNVDADVLATGGQGPLITVKDYRAGQFIYYGVLQPIIGHGGYDVSMYSYMIFREAIEWAFENASLPIIKLSPWQYPYDAAFVVRHDLENWATLISNIEASAQYEFNAGVRGDYYFTTGTVRSGSEDNQMTEAQKLVAIAGLQSAATNYGATIGSHNGGLANPNATLPPVDYDYWHWGTDEALDASPAGYPDGKAYASASVSISFADIEGWLAGLDNGLSGCGVAANCPRNWASPGFNSTREDSYDIMETLGVSTMGEQKAGLYPHWTVSTQTQGLRYNHISIPTSEWYLGNDIAQSMESYSSDAEIDEAIDFYYNLGTLINIYNHELSHTGANTQRFITRNSSLPRNWATNAPEVFDWLGRRAPVIVTPSYTQNGTVASAFANISGATDSQTAVEVILPNMGDGNISNIQVFRDGVLGVLDTDYRLTSYGVKVLVGNTITNVEVRYTYGSTFIWGSFDGGGAPTFGVYDLADTTPISDGSQVQLIWVGPDGQIDFPSCEGLPSGDDILLDQSTIQGVLGFIPLKTLLVSPSAPFINSNVYIRAWNAGTSSQSTAFGQSTLESLVAGNTFNANRWNTNSGHTTWLGTAGDGIWQNSTNWVGEAIPNSNTMAVIPTGADVLLNADAQTSKLCVANGSILDLATYNLSAEYEVVNQGSLRQTQLLNLPDCTGGCSVLEINNLGDTQTNYYGVEIEPVSGNLGSTQVEIRGDQNCGTDGNLSLSVKRCFEIDPTTTSTSIIRFYYHDNDANFNTQPYVYHYNGSTWDELSISSFGSIGEWNYVTANNVTTYSPFLLRDQSSEAPNAVSFSSFEARTTENNLFLMILMGVLLFTAFVIPVLWIQKGKLET